MPSRSRPSLVIWLSVGLFTLGLVYLVRLVGGLTAPDLLLRVPRWYPPLTGAIWGTGWVIGAVATFTGRRWAPRLVTAIGVAFLAWYWFDRLVFVRSEYALQTMPFSLGLTALAAASVIVLLRQLAVRYYFGESIHE